MKTSVEPKKLAARQLLYALLGFLTFAPLAAHGDSAPPYVFVVLDTSGSMNWTPVCTHLDAAADIDPYDGVCTSACPLGDETCARVCPEVGCTEYAEAPPDPAAMTPIVIDNKDTANFSFSPGSMPTQRTGRQHYAHVSDTFDDTDSYLPGSVVLNDSLGDSAHYTVKTAARSFTFNRPLDHAGLWHVYAFWYSGTSSTNATNTRFEINYFDGAVNRTQVLQVDQKEPRQAFVYLATVDFKANGGTVPASVVVRNTNELNQLIADGDIVADAVAFVPVPEKPPESVCLSTGYTCRQPLCPAGGCMAPMAGDDPTSKFFQVKQALYEVVAGSPGVHLGFGSFEQDNARVRFKHWSYRVKASQPALFNFQDGPSATIPFPRPGSIDVFGTGAPYGTTGRTTTDNNGFHCATSTNTNPGTAGFDENQLVGCMPAFPADARDPWEMARVRSVPKLGKGGNVTTSFFVRTWTGPTFQVYRIDWKYYSAATRLGQPTFRALIDIYRCFNLTADPACTSSAYRQMLVNNGLIDYELVGEQIPYELTAGRNGIVGAGFFENQYSGTADNTCEGLEPNEDWFFSPTTATDDAFATYPFKHPPLLDGRGDFDPAGAPLSPRKTVFDRGDFLPLDWLDDNHATVARYLAPNDAAGYSTPAGSYPDYRIGTYFHDDNLSVDSPTTLDRRLRLRDDVYQSSPGVWAPTANPPLAYDPNQRPLIASGSTPLLASATDFRNWYQVWKTYAQIEDPSWAERKKYLLFITDGDETCDTGSPAPPICNSGNPIDLLASAPPQDSVATFVVAFATPYDNVAATCMAAYGKSGPGGTPGVPALPRTYRELKQSIEDFFNTVVFGGSP